MPEQMHTPAVRFAVLRVTSRLMADGRFYALRRRHHFRGWACAGGCTGGFRSEAISIGRAGFSGVRRGSEAFGVQRATNTLPGTLEGKMIRLGWPRSRAASSGSPSRISAAPRRNRLITASAVSSSKAIHRGILPSTRPSSTTSYLKPDLRDREIFPPHILTPR